MEIRQPLRIFHVNYIFTQHTHKNCRMYICFLILYVQITIANIYVVDKQGKKEKT